MSSIEKRFNIRDFDVERLNSLKGYVSEKRLNLLKSVLNLKETEVILPNTILEVLEYVNYVIEEVLFELKEQRRKLNCKKKENEEKILKLKEKREPLSSLNNYIKEKMRIVRSYKRREEKRISPLTIKDDSLTRNQEKIFEEMIEGRLTIHNNVLDMVSAYKYLIRNYDYENINIYYYGERTYELILKNCSNEDAIGYFSVILKEVNKKLRKIRKNQTFDNQESVLRIVKSIFSSSLKQYRKNKKDGSYGDTLYNRFVWLLSSRYNYNAIKLLIDRIPLMVNLRSYDEHIFLYVLKRYLNVLLKYNNDRVLYRDEKEFYKHICMVFVNNSNLNLDISEKVNLNKLVADFFKNLQSLNIDDKNKRIITGEVNAVLNIIEEKDEVKECFDDYEKELALADYRKIYRINRGVIISDNSVICTVGVDSDGRYIVNIHTLDKQAYVNKDLLYTEDSFIRREEIELKDEFSISSLRFEKNKHKPAITYSFVFSNTGNLIDLNIISSCVYLTSGSQYDSESNSISYEYYRELYEKTVGLFESDCNFISKMQLLVLGKLVSFLPLVYYKKVTEVESKISSYYDSDFWKLYNYFSNKDKESLVSAIRASHERTIYGTSPLYDRSMNIFNANGVIDLYNQSIISDYSKGLLDEMSINEIKKESEEIAGILNSGVPVTELKGRFKGRVHK